MYNSNPMPTPPPRKRFQIHLSTAIVMMFVAGGMIYANSIDRGPYESRKYSGGQSVEFSECVSSYGWPFRFIHGAGCRLLKGRISVALLPEIEYSIGVLN